MELPPYVKKAWDSWNIQGFILLSLFLQILLVLFAPFRKRTANTLMIILIWSAYSAADWTANFVVGLITNSIVKTSIPDERGDLLAFWAPFLLLHLGGPDTITAFALEDNELWIRYLLGFIFQLLASLYIFFLSLPRNKLLIPTFLMFLAGTVKCVERLRALYLARLDSIRESMFTKPEPRHDYSNVMREYDWKVQANIPVRIQMFPEPNRVIKAEEEVGAYYLSDLAVLQHAYGFVQTFKGLYVNLRFSLRDRARSRNFFLTRTPKDAFKVIEAENNFIYDVLYTKVAAVRCKLGYFLRFISFGSVVLALVLFYLTEKQSFQKFDVGITYSLLLGATTLDTTAVLVLIFSDWSAAAIKNRFFVTNIVKKMVIVRRRWLSQSRMGILGRRWSESVPQYNFIYYCLHQRPRMMDKIVGFLRLANILDGVKNVSSKPFATNLRDFIFNELRMKSELADDLDTAQEIYSAKGDWVLRMEGCDNFLRLINEADYEKSLLLWHIATELCYNTDEGNDANKDFRDFSKLLSDYMLYILVVRPFLTSALSGSCKVRFQDTCDEANSFFEGEKLGQKQACEKILAVNTAIKPVAVTGDRSKSALFDACILAKALKEFKGDKWKIISKVWVELLSYAACRCRAYTHAQLLSKGGELLTLVWLLMAHFGFGEHFEITEGYAREKLIVGK